MLITSILPSNELSRVLCAASETRLQGAVSVTRLQSYGPEAKFRRSGPGEAEGGGPDLRETSFRSPTPSLAGPARLKGARPRVSRATVVIRDVSGSIVFELLTQNGRIKSQGCQLRKGYVTLLTIFQM